MKLSRECFLNGNVKAAYKLPEFNIEEVTRKTHDHPVWLHFGAGNIFRAFPAVMCQQLLNEGLMETGIICCEGYDEEIVSRCFQPYENLTIAVTLNADGNIGKEIVASVTESLTMLHDQARVRAIFENPSLQMVSFTITEKGYSLRNAAHELTPAVVSDMENGPQGCKTFMGQLTALCLARKASCNVPLALVSMDNCSHNGEKLQLAVMEIAQHWRDNGKISAEELDYLGEKVSFPWSMIDKITPRPDDRVRVQLEADGFEGIAPFVTSKNTYIAAFVNAEKPQYLVVEDIFPNGHPPLERAGVIFTDRETVNKVEKMKVCTCLNPLHTALAVYGCLLGYTSIADEMKDRDLVTLIETMSRTEGMPVVVDPGIIDPHVFLQEVLTERFPNPFMPDTPQRIATDTSQKLPVRFGENIKAHLARGTAGELKFIPLVLAGWIRYLLGVDDAGEKFTCSPDPLLTALQEKLSGAKLGAQNDTEILRPLLSDAAIFGVDLYQAGLAEKVIGYWQELMAGTGTVRRTLQKYTQENK